MTDILTVSKYFILKFIMVDILGVIKPTTTFKPVPLYVRVYGRTNIISTRHGRRKMNC